MLDKLQNIKYRIIIFIISFMFRVAFLISKIAMKLSDKSKKRDSKKK